MSTWYDERAGRYRESVPFKFFYRWTWPVTRWLMFHCMTSEAANWFGIHVAIPTVHRIDQVWSVIAFPFRLRIRWIPREK